MLLTYRIRDWGLHFENSRSRDYKKLDWVPIPNKHDGKGYRRLMAEVDGAALLGAWLLIVQVASKCRVRGVLADNEGPLDASDLAIKTGAPVMLFERALEFLKSPRIGWVEHVDLDSVSVLTEPVSVLCRTERNGTERNRNPEPEAGAFSKQAGREPGNPGQAASVFAGLKVSDLLDDEKLKRWYDFATSRPNPIVAASEVSLLRVFGAAVHAALAKTVGGRPVRSRVGLFGAIVSKGETAGGWSVITQSEEDAARKRLKRAMSSLGGSDG